MSMLQNIINRKNWILHLDNQLYFHIIVVRNNHPILYPYSIQVLDRNQLVNISPSKPSIGPSWSLSWMSNTITSKELRERQDDYMYVDVREADELE
jgi:hypothetical protein